MITLLCTLSFVVNSGSINWWVKESIEGKLIKEGESKYIVDFREGLKKYPLTVNPQNYDKVLINKSDCVKE